MKNLLTLAALAAFALPATAATAQAVDGQKVFMQSCAMCHYPVDKPDDQPRMGPSLKNVFGRKAGTLPGFTRFSPAMKKYGKAWNDQTLDAFLIAPRTEVPGTMMGFAGIPDAAKRKALIAFLKKPAGK